MSDEVPVDAADADAADADVADADAVEGDAADADAADADAADADAADADAADAAAGKGKASIFIAYSADAGFQEKRFVVQLVRELKANGLAESVWFDKDEGLFESSAWVAHSLEAAERCLAAVLFLSESFFACPLALHSLRTLAERLHDSRGSLSLFSVVMGPGGRSGLDQLCPPVVADALKAEGAALVHLSAEQLAAAAHRGQSELVAECSARLVPRLERFAPHFRPLLPEPLLPAGFTGQFSAKRFLAWSVNDLQEWLQSLDVREYYRQQFAEQGVDGYLAYSLTDADLSGALRVDVQLVRRKITKEILHRLQDEQRDSWSGRCRLTKPRPGSVFLVCDPRRDTKTRDALESALQRRRVQTRRVEDMGSSRDDFLRKNGPVMAACGHVLVLLTESSPRSAIFYHCVMFAEWLGRRVIVLFLTNSWFELRPALRALLYDVEGLDFSGQPVADSLEELTAAITAPVKSHPSVVLEQSYLKRMGRKLQPAGYLAHTSASLKSLDSASTRIGRTSGSRTGTQFSLTTTATGLLGRQPTVFISYHWDSTESVTELRRFLISHGVRALLDTDKSPDEVSMKIMKGVRDDGSRKVFIEKAMQECDAVILAVTPRYLQSDNCQFDIEAAYRQRRPLLPVLLGFCAWPPDASCCGPVRRRLAATSAIDISCERLAGQNLRRLLQRVEHAAAAVAAAASAAPHRA